MWRKFSFRRASCLQASDSDPIKVPQSPRAAGVFLLIEGGEYTFNFTAARAACLILDVAVASRAQMERAVRRGLETCKFGWIAEQIAAVPRLTSDKKCGNGKTGVVTWAARADRRFGVFCFNASEETPNGSTACPQSSTLPTPLTALSQTSTPSGPSTKSPPSRKPFTTKAPEQTSFILLIKRTHSTRTSSTSPTLKPSSTSPTLKPSSTHIPATHIPASPSQFIKSKPAVVSFVFPASVHASSFSPSSESVTPQPASSARRPLGNVPTALIILGVIVVLLTAAGVVFYCKLNIFTSWSREPQKDDAETEMWKRSHSEMDLHEAEESESDRKYSSDITLCVNPDFKTNSSE
ncbi:lymphatic vessel endothelial hyaluronic receptor 1b [Lycodopsis pacificus]